MPRYTLIIFDLSNGSIVQGVHQCHLAAKGDTLGVQGDLFRRCLDTLLYSTFPHRGLHVFLELNILGKL